MMPAFKLGFLFCQTELNLGLVVEVMVLAFAIIALLYIKKEWLK